VADNFPLNAPLYVPFVMPPTNRQVEAAERQAVVRTKSFAFDYSVGDFVRDGTGRIAKSDGPQKVASWAIKTLLTERFAWLIYPHRYGVEFDQAMQGGQPRGIAEGVVRRTATEALMQHEHVQAIQGIDFSWYGDQLTVDVRIVLHAGGAQEQVSLRLEVMGFG
jgi:Protein of unknown function (DUF2634)